MKADEAKQHFETITKKLQDLENHFVNVAQFEQRFGNEILEKQDRIITLLENLQPKDVENDGIEEPIKTSEPEPTPKNKLLTQLLIDEEGIELETYKDTRGFQTIGIGHNLSIDQTEEELRAIGLDTLPSTWDGFKITIQQAYDLFEIDVQDTIDDIATVFSEEELDALGETRRAIILSMVFQLGGAGFRKFKNFIAMVKQNRFAEAATEMMDSLAARQTPQRWTRASDAMENGYFEKYQEKKQAGKLGTEVLSHMEKSIG